MKAIVVTILALGISMQAIAKNEKTISALKPSQESGLVSAYKREYAFLLSQKRILEEQKQAIESQSESKLAEARAKLAELRSEYLGITKLNEKLTAQFDTVQVRSENQGQIFSQLEGMLEQAQSTVGSASATEKEGEKQDLSLAVQLSSVFSKAKEKLTTLSKVTTESGKFFLPNGEKVDGQIVKVGGIAAYGSSESFSGGLEPAGQGFLKAREELSLSDVSATAIGNLPNLQIFIYEDVSKEVVEAKEQTAIEVVESGGSIAWIIVALGLISLGVVFLRGLRLRSLSRFDAKKLDDFEECLKKGDLKEAQTISVTAAGSMGRLLQSAVSNFKSNAESLEDSLTEVIAAEQVKIERFGTMILVFASVAPLMGLLGTVTGMISTFDIITQFGTGDPKLLSGGISEALVTTELGLIVAIPSLLLGNFLSGWATNLQNQMENFALRVINIKDEISEDKNA